MKKLLISIPVCDDGIGDWLHGVNMLKFIAIHFQDQFELIACLVFSAPKLVPQITKTLDDFRAEFRRPFIWQHQELKHPSWSCHKDYIQHRALTDPEFFAQFRRPFIWQRQELKHPSCHKNYIQNRALTDPEFFAHEFTHVIEVSCRRLAYFVTNNMKQEDIPLYLQNVETFVHLHEIGAGECTKYPTSDSSSPSFTNKQTYEIQNAVMGVYHFHSLGPLENEQGFFFPKNPTSFQPITPAKTSFHAQRPIQPQPQQSAFESRRNNKSIIILGSGAFHPSNISAFCHVLMLSKHFYARTSQIAFAAKDIQIPKRFFLNIKGESAPRITQWRNSLEIEIMLSSPSPNTVIVQLPFLPEADYKRLRELPCTAPGRRGERYYFYIIGGDNAFAEAVAVTTTRNIIPIFAFPGHKDDFIKSLILELASKYQKLSHFIDITHHSIQISNYKDTIYSGYHKFFAFNELDRIASEWFSYCLYLKEHKSADECLVKMLTPLLCSPDDARYRLNLMKQHMKIESICKDLP